MTKWLIVAAAAVTLLNAQTPQRLTLKEAEATALKNNPRVGIANLTSSIAGQSSRAVRSAYFPTVVAGLAAATAIDRSRIAAGAFGLNNPVILDRVATGVTLTQLIGDFGRTPNLARSASLRADAERESARATRADVLLEVNRAWFTALRAQALLTAAEQTVATRHAEPEQAEAKLLVLTAQNDIGIAFAELSHSMGLNESRTFDLVDDGEISTLDTSAKALIAEALANRPEVAQLKLEVDAARRFAGAERNLSMPTISGIATTGVSPIHDPVNLRDRWAAAGVVVSVPLFNGKLFDARRASADLQAQVAEKRLEEFEIRLRRDVEVAFLNARTAFQRMEATAQLLEQASRALESSQARLQKTSAEIAHATARFDYRIQRAVLSYVTGALR